MSGLENIVVAPNHIGLYPNTETGKTGFTLNGLPEVFQLRVPYVLEMYKEGTIYRSMPLPMKPRELFVDKQAPTNLTFTANAVTRQNAPFRAMKIQCKGHTGLQYRLGHNHNGETIFKDGPALMREFDRFLTLYQEESAKNSWAYLYDPDNPRANTDHKTYMVFRAFVEGIHVKVETRGFRWQRNESTRVAGMATWDLVLDAYAPIKPKVPGSILGDLAGDIQRVAGVIDEANTYLALTNNVLANVRADLEILRAPVRALSRTVGEIESAMDGVFDVLDVPRLLFADVLQLAGQVQGALFNIATDAELFGDAYEQTFVDDIRDLLFGADNLAAQNVATLGAMGGGPESIRTIQQAQRTENRGNAGFHAIEHGSANQPLQVHTLRQGDTLTRLANAIGVDRERIVEINRMRDPNTFRDGTIWRPGAQVLLPQLSGRPLPYEDAQENTRRKMGVGLKLDDQGRMSVRPDGLDFDLVDGPEYVKQALLTRMTTPQGSSQWWPNYGPPALPGSSGAVLGYAASHYAEQLRNEPCIADVGEVLVQDRGDGLEIVAKVEIIGIGGTELVLPTL